MYGSERIVPRRIDYFDARKDKSSMSVVKFTGCTTEEDTMLRCMYWEVTACTTTKGGRPELHHGQQITIEKKLIDVAVSSQYKKEREKKDKKCTRLTTETRDIGRFNSLVCDLARALNVASLVAARTAKCQVVPDAGRPGRTRTATLVAHAARPSQLQEYLGFEAASSTCLPTTWKVNHERSLTQLESRLLRARSLAESTSGER